MEISQDTQQTLNLVIQISLTSFKVAMACLLSVFVPQDCGGHECELHENFSNLHDYNAFVLAWNFLTLFTFSYVFWYEGKREMYMISHLDVSKDYPDNYLSQALVGYPKIKTHLDIANKHYAKIYRCLGWIIGINTILSAILLFVMYYQDFRTVTVFLSNLALVGDRVWKGYSISQQCEREGLAISIYQTENTYFNVVDKDYIREPSQPSVERDETQPGISPESIIIDNQPGTHDSLDVVSPSSLE